MTTLDRASDDRFAARRAFAPAAGRGPRRSPATRSGCWSRTPERRHPRRVPRPAEQLRAGRRAGREQLGHRRRRARRRRARRGRVVLHVATPLDDGDLGGRAAHGARRRPAPCSTPRPGERFAVGRACGSRSLEPYPRAGSSPTGAGNRLWRAPGRAATCDAQLARHGRPIALRLPRPALPAGGLPVGLRAPTPAAPRCLRRAAVHRRRSSPGWSPRGVAVAPVTLHTGVSSQEAGEAPQAERFDVPTATARLVNAARAGGGRVVAVGTTVTRALESAVDADGRRGAPAAAGPTASSRPADPPRGRRRPGHRLARPAGLAPAAGRGGRRHRPDPAAYDAAVAGGYLGTSSATRRCCCPEPDSPSRLAPRHAEVMVSNATDYPASAASHGDVLDLALDLCAAVRARRSASRRAPSRRRPASAR